MDWYLLLCPCLMTPEGSSTYNLEMFEALEKKKVVKNVLCL